MPVHLSKHVKLFYMPKAFDKVWHAGLIYKLKSGGVFTELLKLINNFLNIWSLLNGQTSDWLTVKAGVHQGFILRPLFFLIYINDLPDNSVSLVKLIANGTSLFSTVHDTDASRSSLNNDLKKFQNGQWKI